MFMKFLGCRGSSLSALMLGPLLCSLWGNGADLDGHKMAECRWADGSITIDGKADEPAWKNAQLIDNFQMAWLGPGDHPAPTKTRARLLWDREYLYFFAEMEDTDVFANVKEHNGQTWDNDVFELFFKPATNKTGYYEFQVNAANTKFDMFLPSRGAGAIPRFKNERKFHVDSAVVVDGTLNQWEDRDTGWSVEGRIPWRDLAPTGGRPEINEVWTFALCRYDYSADLENPALSSSAPLAQRDFHHYEDYAPLKFVGPAKSARAFGIEERPLWTNSYVIGSPDPPPPYRTVNAFPKLKVHLPVAIANEPGSDRLLFLEHANAWTGTGKLRRFVNRPEVAEAETLLELGDIIYGLTFHPNFKTNGFIYLGCNGPESSTNKQTRVVRYTVERTPPCRLDPQSRQLIIEWPSDGHNGGDVTFGLDGMLYVTSGDGTSDSDANIVGQDLTKLTAKVLRIDVDHPSAGKAYSVPKDNPFLNRQGVRPETWAYGLRNPWRITTDRQTGQIWLGENGQDLWEIARLVIRGANYGWSIYEGSHPFKLNRKLGPDPVTISTIERPHSELRSLTGGIVYYGSKFPELRGAYIYGDWSTGRIWGGRHDDKKFLWHKELTDTPFAITGFGADENGELLVVDEGSGFYRLERTPAEAPTNNFPTKLSEPGLFVSVKDREPDPGLIPYSVNSPLWSDGALKERFIAIPGNGKIEFTHNRGWTFPEGTVLVKTFSLETEQGRPTSRKRIETRLLTRQQKEWVGYSYIWNDEQTGALLVDAKGLDKEFVLSLSPPRGEGRGKGSLRQTRKQTWHYPSRTECMVCHSRAANFVLGLTEAQMNKDHQYRSVTDNQLRVLEHLGLLEVNWWDYERNVPWTHSPPAQHSSLSSAGGEGRGEQAIESQPHRITSAPNQREPAPVGPLLPRDPEHMRRLADPRDQSASLNDRARSYLQANCAQCHVEAGGGNSLIDLEFTTPAEKMRIFDVRPQHHTFDIAGARLIAPGHPDRSVLLHRIANREAGHMPPLATSIIDQDAVKLLTEWIAAMK